MSASETSSRTTSEPTYKGRKSARRTWPVGCGPILKKLPSFPDYEQPFALTEEQIREMMTCDKENEHTKDEDSLFIVEEEVRYEEEVCSYEPTWDYEEKVEESEEEDDSEEKSDSDDPYWDPKENYTANKKTYLAKKKK